MNQQKQILNMTDQKIRVAGRVLVLSIGALAAGASHAQSSVTLYGLIDMSIAYANNQTSTGKAPGHAGWAMNSGNLSSSRWGIRGNEDLGGGTSAVFTLENGFSANNGTFSNGGDLFGRQAFVGLSSNTYGTVTFGRQYDFIIGFVTPLGASGPGWGGNLAMHPFDNDDSIQNLRINNSVKYVSPMFHGVTVGAMYGFSNAAGQFSNNRAYSAGISYANGPLSLGAAYLQVDRDSNPSNVNTTGAFSTVDGDSTINGGRERVWAFGGRYIVGAASVGLAWTHSTTDDVTGGWQGGKIGALSGRTLTLDNYSVDGRYFCTPAASVAVAYTFTDGRFDAGKQSARPKWNQVVVQGDYALSKRTDVYLEGVYKRVNGGNGIAAFNASVYSLAPSANNTQVVVAAGMRHRF